MIETICEGKVGDKSFLALKKMIDPENGVNGYFFSHESRCEGKIIALLPYRLTSSGIELLLRNEVTPCWGLNQYISSITGGFEGGDPRDTAIMELKEEGGYKADKNELISLGTSFASKSADTVYYLYTINLTDKDRGEATGDGSELEKKAACVWAETSNVEESKDPQVSVMFLRLQKLLNK